MYCLWFAALFIVSGCSTQSKRENIIGIQKIRIQKLEKQLARKNNVISKFKVQKWTRQAPSVPESKALKVLKNKMKNKQWVSALKLSGKLKEFYPKSITLAKYRMLIFKKMGLKKQAFKEYKFIKARRALKQKTKNARKI